jgi:hypothetical protein
MMYSSRRCFNGAKFFFFCLTREEKKKKSLNGVNYSWGNEKRKAKKMRMKTTIVVDSWDIDKYPLLKGKKEKKKKK